MSTLKPCPFCGQNPVRDKTNEPDGKHYHYIFCPDCGNGPNGVQEGHWSKGKAEKRWNFRPHEQSLLKRAEQAELERDALLGVMTECPDEHFGSHFLVDGKVPAWCSLRFDQNGEPTFCDENHFPACWLKWAADQARKALTSRGDAS